MDTERQAGTGGSVPPLTRADVERLRSKVESAAPGFELQEVSCGETSMTITARAINPEAACPSCGKN